MSHATVKVFALVVVVLIGDAIVNSVSYAKIKCGAGVPVTLMHLFFVTNKMEKT